MKNLAIILCALVALSSFSACGSKVEESASAPTEQSSVEALAESTTPKESATPEESNSDAEEPQQILNISADQTNEERILDLVQKVVDLYRNDELTRMVDEGFVRDFEPKPENVTFPEIISSENYTYSESDGISGFDVKLPLEGEGSSVMELTIASAPDGSFEAYAVRFVAE